MPEIGFVVRQKGQRGEVKNKGTNTNTVFNKTQAKVHNPTHLRWVEGLATGKERGLTKGFKRRDWF